MASSRGIDPAWKYATVIEGNRYGTKCKFCESIFQSGGITRLKSHLLGYDAHKSVKKCEKVPAYIKHEVIAWIKKNECIKQDKKVIEEDIRQELRNDYLGSKKKFYDDDESDGDDGYQYPADVHPAERDGYREHEDIQPYIVITILSLQIGTSRNEKHHPWRFDSTGQNSICNKSHCH
ncbi:hypothetical protein ACLB2K_041997 [Fragaria x ananassa]